MAPNKPIVLTYTMLSTFEICPHQCFRRYVKRDLPYVETPEMRWGNEVHAAFEYRVGGRAQLPVNMIQWEPFAAALDGLNCKTEVKLGITREGKPTGFFDNDVWFRGKADVVAISGDTAFLPDWKTSKKPREEPFELATNGMLVKAHNPYLTKITGSYVWLHPQKMGLHHDVSDVNSTWAKVNNMAEEMRDCMRSGEWEKKQSPLCGWCNCFDCEHNTNQKRG